MENTLCRVWKLNPPRADFMRADISLSADESSTPCLRINPGVERNSSEWDGALRVARENSFVSEEDISVGYAYFAADISATEEPVFDPELTVCQYGQGELSGYFRQKF